MTPAVLEILLGTMVEKGWLVGGLAPRLEAFAMIIVTTQSLTPSLGGPWAVTSMVTHHLRPGTGPPCVNVFEKLLVSPII